MSSRRRGEVGKYLIDSLAWNAVNRWRRNQTEERVLKIHSTSSTIIYSRGRLGLLTLPTVLQRTHTNFFGSSKSRMNDKKYIFTSFFSFDISTHKQAWPIFTDIKNNKSVWRWMSTSEQILPLPAARNTVRCCWLAKADTPLDCEMKNSRNKNCALLTM